MCQPVNSLTAFVLYKEHSLFFSKINYSEQYATTKSDKNQLIGILDFHENNLKIEIALKMINNAWRKKHENMNLFPLFKVVILDLEDS